ncbi:IS66 family insertion sequence hypothetical protein [Pseudomonas syringae pv. tomato]|nr:IS66 family insertion sequence hypothetical protein [Pseudomonas syringae pv. tomato]PYD06672.1 IS66 family insertion sequence hypothetical protein [Pseudomonas syringae pv. maculicola]
MRPDAKVEKVYLYPKPVDFRKSIDGLATLVELDIKVAVLLKQMLAKMQSRMGMLEEQVALLRQRLFGQKSEQMIDPKAPQMALFNDA